MSKKITFKSKDIREALAIKTSQFRTWVENLPPHSNMVKHERSAVKYDFSDLIYFFVIKHITDTYGISTSSLSKVSQEIYSSLRSPQSIKHRTFLLVDFSNRSCKKLLQDKQIDAEGIVIDLQPIHEQLLKYLGVVPEQKQNELPFGLAQVI
ncbi:hypothetical protein AVO42_02945 [Thiomicrospira sp. XS5]|uniref:hypothetical protein n=1 Tax=Thiomicrospira sp. XS5 TaxID=1775636 RepID=UPI0007466B59|nr:hypothetical protein [Thiomicrospira sp. XS5]KUJ74383.1 hypothetical protein AVO42_02945 [Thiomicrospira sp. XS5]